MAIKIPRLDDFAEWRDMQQRLTELKVRRDAADRRVQELLGQQRAANAPITESERQQRAREMVMGSATASVVPLLDGEEIGRNLRTAREERATLDVAVDLQTREAEALRYRLGRQICEGLRAHHHRIGLRILNALVEASAASAEDHDFRKALEDAGIPYSTVLR